MKSRGIFLPRFSALALTSYLCAGLECGAGECRDVLLWRRIVGSRDTNDALFLNDALITRLSNIHTLVTGDWKFLTHVLRPGACNAQLNFRVALIHNFRDENSA